MTLHRTLLILWVLLSYSGLRGQESVTDSGKIPDHPVSWGMDADINTKYIWRGMTVNDGLMVQPELWTSYRGFTAGVWGNLTAWDRFGAVKGHEIDLFLTYDYNLGKLEVNHSLMFYFYPTQENVPNTGEFYLGLGYPIGDFKLVSVATVDIVTYPGAIYVEHAIEYEKAWGDRFTLSTSAGLSWASGKFNAAYLGVDKTTINLATLNLDLTWVLWGPLYIKPHVQVNRFLNQDLATSAGASFPWFTGLMIGAAF